MCLLFTTSVFFRERDEISFEWCRHCRLPAPPTSMGLKVACPLRRPHALLTHTHTHTHVPGVGRTHGRHPPPQKHRRDGNRRRTTVGSFETSWRATGEYVLRISCSDEVYPRSAASPLDFFRSKGTGDRGFSLSMR